MRVSNDALNIVVGKLRDSLADNLRDDAERDEAIRSLGQAVAGLQGWAHKFSHMSLRERLRWLILGR